MPYLNVKQRQLETKVVYYGAGLSGKTTNLQAIRHQSGDERVGELMQLDTAGDRTLFFDWLPFDIGKINGCRVKIQLFTVPGQPRYVETRKRVLRDADGVVLVLDSQTDALERNRQIVEEMWRHFEEAKLGKVAVVVQLNKRDLPEVMSREQLLEELDLQAYETVEAVAKSGKGVMETLRAISCLVVRQIRADLRDQSRTIAAGVRSGLDGEALATSFGAAGREAFARASTPARGGMKRGSSLDAMAPLEQALREPPRVARPVNGSAVAHATEVGVALPAAPQRLELPSPALSEDVETRLHQRLDELAEQLIALAPTRETVAAQGQRLEAIYSALGGLRGELDTRLARALEQTRETHNEQLGAQVGELKGELLALGAAAEASVCQSEELERQLGDIKQELEALRGQLGGGTGIELVGERIDGLQAELTALREAGQSSSSGAELDGVRAELERLHELVSGLGGEGRVVEQLAQLEASVTELRVDAQAGERLEGLERSVAQLQELLAELDKGEQLAGLGAELEQLRAQLLDGERELSDAQLESLVARVGEAAREPALGERLGELETQLEGLARRLEEDKDERLSVAQLRSELESARGAVELATGEQVEALVAALGQLALAGEGYDRVSERLVELEAKLAGIDGALVGAATGEQLAQLGEALGQREGLAPLETRLGALEAALEQLGGPLVAELDGRFERVDTLLEGLRAASEQAPERGQLAALAGELESLHERGELDSARGEQLRGQLAELDARLRVFDERAEESEREQRQRVEVLAREVEQLESSLQRHGGQLGRVADEIVALNELTSSLVSSPWREGVERELAELVPLVEAVRSYADRFDELEGWLVALRSDREARESSELARVEQLQGAQEQGFAALERELSELGPLLGLTQDHTKQLAEIHAELEQLRAAGELSRTHGEGISQILLQLAQLRAGEERSAQLGARLDALTEQLQASQTGAELERGLAELRERFEQFDARGLAGAAEQAERDARLGEQLEQLEAQGIAAAELFGHREARLEGELEQLRTDSRSRAAELSAALGEQLARLDARADEGAREREAQRGELEQLREQGRAGQELARAQTARLAGIEGQLEQLHAQRVEAAREQDGRFEQLEQRLEQLRAVDSERESEVGEWRAQLRGELEQLRDEGTSRAQLGAQLEGVQAQLEGLDAALEAGRARDERLGGIEQRLESLATLDELTRAQGRRLDEALAELAVLASAGELARGQGEQLKAIVVELASLRSAQSEREVLGEQLRAELDQQRELLQSRVAQSEQLVGLEQRLAGISRELDPDDGEFILALRGLDRRLEAQRAILDSRMGEVMGESILERVEALEIALSGSPSPSEQSEGDEPSRAVGLAGRLASLEARLESSEQQVEGVARQVRAAIGSLRTELMTSMLDFNRSIDGIEQETQLLGAIKDGVGATSQFLNAQLDDLRRAMINREAANETIVRRNERIFQAINQSLSELAKRFDRGIAASEVRMVKVLSEALDAGWKASESGIFELRDRADRLEHTITQLNTALSQGEEDDKKRGWWRP